MAFTLHWGKTCIYQIIKRITDDDKVSELINKMAAMGNRRYLGKDSAFDRITRGASWRVSRWEEASHLSASS